MTLVRGTRNWIPYSRAKEDNTHRFVKRRRLLDGIADMMPEEQLCEKVLALADEGLTYVQIAERLTMTQIDVIEIVLDARTDEYGNVEWRSE